MPEKDIAWARKMLEEYRAQNEMGLVALFEDLLRYLLIKIPEEVW